MFTAFVTALEVMVAAVMASTVFSAGVPPALITRSGVCLPLNWSVKAASLDFAPRPAVSEKFAPPTEMPVSTAEVSKPAVTSISPPKPLLSTVTT